MGIEEETDRTLFIRNLDSRVTEELLFELFIQAGPLSRTKIPKDNDGKQKTFGFAVYKHEVSVPYAMKLLDGTALFGRTIHIQFRSGSSHSNSPGNSQNISPANTSNPGQRSQVVQLNSPPYTPPSMQRSFSTPDNLQKHVMMNNMMWQLQMQQMQQLQQLNGGFGLQQRSQSGNGGRSYSGSSLPQDNTSYRQQQQQQQSSSPMNTGSSGHHGRRYSEEVGSGHHQQHGHGRESYRHHDDRGGSGGNRQGDDRAGNRQHDDRSGNRGYQDGRRRRY